MRILLDTNIIILREDNKILDKNLQLLFDKLNQSKVVILVHPKSLEELERDKNEERKKIALSKARTYTLLDSPPDPSENISFKNRLNWDGCSNLVDINLLYAVDRNAIDFLLTEDKEIHKFARILHLDDRVFLIEEALEFFTKIECHVDIKPPPALKEAPVHNLDINDPLFDILKSEYKGFERWFEKIAREGRKCLVHYRNDKSLGALLIYKTENEPLSTIPPLNTKERLKLCTFIVTHVGYRIGELFLKLSIDYAIQKNIFEIYLTHFTKPNDYLVQLILEFGFYKVAEKTNGEDVYLKCLVPRSELDLINPIEISKKFYPSFYDGKRVRKFIIPIVPEYHERLFTDYPGRQSKIMEHFGEFIIEGNTIKKAYLTHSNISKIRKGDLLIFYRSQDDCSITSIGVVESFIQNQTKTEDVIKLVSKRTVYTKDEIDDFVKKPTSILLFLHHVHLRKPINLFQLKQIGALNAAPQSIVEISNQSYKKIKIKGEIDERFTFNETKTR